ncbi:hypothetical protein [Marinobacter sp.]|uniref:hypothetical protein n=1 Tax=Marinobacter sp. TaxID=50741 RepID=UPI00384C1FA2
MTKKLLPLMAGLVLVAGCQSTPPALDGIRGYEADVREDTVVLTFTDTARRSWPEMRHQALDACAEVTEKDRDTLRFVETDRSEFTRQVPTVISVPVRSFPPSGAQSPRQNPMPPPAEPTTLMQYESMNRLVSLKQIQGRCEER